MEADPWCFRSGYAKGRLLRRLRSRPLSQAQTQRLGAVVLHGIDVGGRLELRDVTRLARRLDSPTLRGELRRRLHGPDAGVARRALLALFDLRRPRLTSADVERARRLVLEELRRRETNPDDWSLPRWPERIGARLASAEWTQELIDEVRTGGPDRNGALIVLAELSHVPLSADDRTLISRLLVDRIRHGGDESWIEGIASHVASDALRDQVNELLNDDDEDVRRRAWWVLNASGT